MKKSLLAATLALSCVCMLGVAGCGGNATNTNANNTNTASTASVATNTNNTASTANTTANTNDTSGSTTTSNSASADTNNEAGTAEYAVTIATDEGVTSLSGAQLQELMDNSLNIGMTLSDVRSAMGGVNGTAMSSGYEPNTFAWYSSDKSKAIIATFTSQDGSGTLVSCEIGID